MVDEIKIPFRLKLRNKLENSYSGEFDMVLSQLASGILVKAVEKTKLKQFHFH